MSWTFYKCDPRAAFEGTRFLTLEQRGAYRDILDLMYIHDGPLPDKPEYFAPALGVSKRKWTALRSALIDAGKILCEDGFLWNERAKTEIENRSKTARKSRENTAKIQRKPNENLVKISESNKISLKNNDLEICETPEVALTREDIRYKIEEERKKEPLLSPLPEPSLEKNEPEQIELEEAIEAVKMREALTAPLRVPSEIFYADGVVTLTGAARASWQRKFGTAERLDLALLQIAPYIQPNGNRPLAAQVVSQLARQLGQKMDSDARYTAASKSKSQHPVDREEAANQAYYDELKRKYKVGQYAGTA